MSKSVYISGAVTGVPDFADRFSTAEAELYALGYIPVSPIRIGEDLKERLGREPDYEEYMAYDLDALALCDHIYLLEGWENSKGARREWERAKELGIDPIYLEDD